MYKFTSMVGTVKLLFVPRAIFIVLLCFASKKVWLWLWLIWYPSPRINIRLHTICRPHSDPSEREQLTREERQMWWRVEALQEIRAGGGSTSLLIPWIIPENSEKRGEKKGRKGEVGDEGNNESEKRKIGWQKKVEKVNKPCWGCERRHGREEAGGVEVGKESEKNQRGDKTKRERHTR